MILAAYYTTIPKLSAYKGHVAPKESAFDYEATTLATRKSLL
jgi:hypothetical protein